MSRSTDNPVWRRFGPEHEKPCKRPEVTTCAMLECQSANQCQWDFSTGKRLKPNAKEGSVSNTKHENYVPQRDPKNTEHIIDLVRAELAERLKSSHAMFGNSLEAEVYHLTHNTRCGFNDLISAIAGMIEGAVLFPGSGTDFEKKVVSLRPLE